METSVGVVGRKFVTPDLVGWQNLLTVAHHVPRGFGSGRGGGRLGGANLGIFVCSFIEFMATVSLDPFRALRFGGGPLSDSLDPICLTDGTTLAASRRYGSLTVQLQAVSLGREMGP